jgi:hypothetical protein
MSMRVHDWVRTGPMPPAQKAARFLLRLYLKINTYTATEYHPPDEQELAKIETALAELGIPCEDYSVDVDEFRHFVDRTQFSPDYHGGKAAGVYDEKLLEHFVAMKLLGLTKQSSGPYVDIAACASPWAKLLRQDGIEAYAIDLEVTSEHKGLPYYRQEDATSSSFADGTVKSASLQCAFEMFNADDDIKLVEELARILKPAGRVVISPLYMHTHACYYQTPEYYGVAKGDPGATAYVRRDCWGVASSRKYSPATLHSRIWTNALRHGLTPRLLALRNKHALGVGIYLHFILILEKPMPASTVLGDSND